jgi:6-pyruvoyltetrahydropterin/6-carboxytetrahydropterin synthase
MKMWEVCKEFRFEAAHTLERTVGTEASRRIHGHSYRARICVTAEHIGPDGMVVDLGLLEEKVAHIHERLDHRMLDDFTDLGPATMENIARWIWDRLATDISSLARVSVFRDSLGEECTYISKRNYDEG